MTDEMLTGKEGEQETLAEGEPGSEAGTSAAGTGEPAGAGKPPEEKPPETPEIPEWLNTAKYGEDVGEAVKKQAQAYSAAEKEMHRALNEAARLRKELEMVTSAVKPSGEASNKAEDYPDDVKKRLEEKYDMPFSQILAMNDIVSMATAPLAEMLYGTQAESVKAKVLNSHPYYEPYKDDIEAGITKLPLKDRANPQKLQEVLNGVLLSKLPEIIEAEKAKAMAGVMKGAKPASAPDALGKGAPAPRADVKQSLLTKGQRDYIANTGGDPDGVEKWLNDLPTKKDDGGWGGYTDY